MARLCGSLASLPLRVIWLSLGFDLFQKGSLAGDESGVNVMALCTLCSVYDLRAWLCTYIPYLWLLRAF